MNRLTTISPAPRLRHLALVAAAAVALSCGVNAAHAQRGAGPMHGHGAAPIEQMIPQLLQEAKAALNLNTSQQVMFDNAAAETKNAHQSARANRETLKSAVQAEIAKAEPDLAALSTTADNVEQQNRALRKQVRTQWLALYATFTPEQKAIVRDMLQKRLANAESFRERMFEKFHGGKAAS